MIPLVGLGQLRGKPYEARVVIGLEWRDAWVGLFLSRDLELYWCPAPMLVVRLTLTDW